MRYACSFFLDSVLSPEQVWELGDCYQVVSGEYRLQVLDSMSEMTVYPGVERLDLIFEPVISEMLTVIQNTFKNR